MEKLYSISEVADKLKLATKTLRRWEESGKFVGNRTLGGQRRYSLTDIQILDAIKHGTIPNSADLLTIDQAAALFGVSAATVVRWENEGRIHPLITAGVTYYPRHRLLEKIAELKKSAAEELAPTEFIPPAVISEPVSLPPAPRLHSPQLTKKNFLSSLYVINIVTTLVLILLYHLLASRPALAPASPTSPSLGIKDSALLSGKGTIPKGKNELRIDLPRVSPKSAVSLTFHSDFAPAKKYWVTVGNGSFTVRTDYPVGQDSEFAYLIFVANEL